MDVMSDGKMYLYGIVGMEFFGDDGFTAMDVIRALATIPDGEALEVHVNSPGGFSDEGVAIYNALANRAGKVTLVGDGMVASAASVIFMAGDERIMRPGCVMMVHDPATFTVGDAADHQKAIASLEATGTAMAALYAKATGRSAEDCRADMKAETWMDAAAAIEKGYADEEEDGEANPTGDDGVIAFNYRLFDHAPERLVALSDKEGWSKKKPVVCAKTSAYDVASRQRALARKPRARVTKSQDASKLPEGDKTEMDVKLASDIAAKCNAAGFAALAPSLLAACEKLESPKAMELVDKRIAEAREITDAVKLANKNCSAIDLKLADEYIAAGRNVDSAKADLLTRWTAVSEKTPQSHSHHAVEGAGKEPKTESGLNPSEIYANRAAARQKWSINA